MMTRTDRLVTVRLVGMDERTVAAAVEQLDAALGDAIQLAAPHHGRRDWLSYGSLHVASDAPLGLAGALQQLVTTARSDDGVTGQAVRAALATVAQADAQLTAIRRILAELNHDGITDDALDAAEAVLDGKESSDGAT